MTTPELKGLIKPFYRLPEWCCGWTVQLSMSSGHPWGPSCSFSQMEAGAGVIEDLAGMLRQLGLSPLHIASGSLPSSWQLPVVCTRGFSSSIAKHPVELQGSKSVKKEATRHPEGLGPELMQRSLLPSSIILSESQAQPRSHVGGSTQGCEHWEMQFFGHHL